MIITLYDILEKTGSLEKRKEIISEALAAFHDDITRLMGEGAVLLKDQQHQSWEPVVIPFEVGRKYYLNDETKNDPEVFLMGFFQKEESVNVVVAEKEEGVFCCDISGIFQPIAAYHTWQQRLRKQYPYF